MRTCLVRRGVRGGVRGMVRGMVPGAPDTVTATVPSGRNDLTRLQPVLVSLTEPRELAGDRVPLPEVRGEREELGERLAAALGVVLAQASSTACSTATSTLGATSDAAVDAPG